MFLAAVAYGGQLEETAVHARGHQFDIPEQRDRAVLASDLLQGADDQDGKLAHSNSK